MVENLGPDFLRPLLFSTGGIGYHLRAWQYASLLWRPFQRDLGHWLNQWPVRSDTVLLIGPSAGYSLSFKWLKRYKKIYLSDPDFIGKILFRRRFKGLEICDVKENLLFPNCKGLKNFLAHHPSVDILFCNVLGQIGGLISSKPTKTQWLNELQTILGHSNFASYHDLCVFTGQFEFKSSCLECLGIDSLEDLIKRFIVQSSVRELVIEDYGLFNFFSAYKKEVLHWEIVPGRHHLIECVKSTDFYLKL